MKAKKKKVPTMVEVKWGKILSGLNARAFWRVLAIMDKKKDGDKVPAINLCGKFIDDTDFLTLCTVTNFTIAKQLEKEGVLDVVFEDGKNFFIRKPKYEEWRKLVVLPEGLNISDEEIIVEDRRIESKPEPESEPLDELEDESETEETEE